MELHVAPKHNKNNGNDHQFRHKTGGHFLNNKKQCRIYPYPFNHAK